MQRVVQGAASERREQTREAILGCAVSRVARAGVEGATLQDVATDAGLSKGAVTHHFANKDDLLDAVMIRCGERLAARITAAVDAQPMPGDRLRALRDAVWSAWDDDVDEARALALLACSALTHPRLRAVSEGAWAATAAVVARAIDETAVVLGLRPRVESEAVARWLLACAAGHRLTRGDAPDPGAKQVLALSLGALFEL